MIAPLAQIAPRLKKLILMLSSDRDGEVVNAARAINNTLHSAGHDWHDLAARLLMPAKTATHVARDSDDRDPDVMREFCLQHQQLLRPRELEFVVSLSDWRGRLTEKQFAWLSAIHARVQREAAA
jgi:hypothetical protein